MFGKPDKKIVQDIVPASSRRTVRNISFSEERVSDRIVSKPRLRKETVKNENPILEKNSKKRRFSGTILTFVIVFICLAVIAIALSLFYSKAVVTIIPKVAPIEINGKFTAKKNAGVSEIPYEIVSLSASETSNIPAIDGPFIETKSKGSAYLYNKQINSQSIVAGTRLSNADGLIYRTTATVTIPAGKNISGKLVPGSVTVSIIADKAGIDYNMSLSDLTGDLKIVAFKGGDKYTTVYGRVKTDLVGGFVGNKKTVSVEARKVAVENLQNSLQKKLSNDLSLSVPTGSILFNNASIFEYQVSDGKSSPSGTVEIVVKATAHGIIFKTGTLIKTIGAHELSKFPVTSYDIKGIETLSFSIVNTKDFSIQKGTPLIFNLKGSLSLVGTVPENTLKNELKGISLEQSNTVFAKYPAIGSAHALITPFWMRSFPSAPEKIIIELKSE
ncbi:MAG: hypothetical protein AAB917_00715 [Patescibacteria group bacterium]